MWPWISYSYWFRFFGLKSTAVAMAVSSFLLYLASLSYIICGAEMRLLGQQQNIAIGSSLNTSAMSKWVSPNGVFAFGFFKTKPSLYLVGIWFDKIPTKTVVWTANREDPVQEGSILQLSNRGLQISHSGTTTMKKIFDVDPQSADAAAMRDDGNFILLDKSNKILWESFGHPIDTLLPGQELQSGSTVFSKATDTNYSKGRFVLTMQENLMLFSANRRRETYWSPQIKIVGNLTSLTFDTDGVLLLVGTSNNYTLWNAAAIYKRVTLDEDGVMRGYVWTGDKANLWRVDWKAMDDPCEVFDQCGFNSYCSLNSNNLVECKCPLGFDFVDDDNHFKGCFRSRPQHSCSAKSVMQAIGNTDFPGRDYTSIPDIDETACKQACLDDCLCAVVVYGNAVCSKKAMPLTDGRIVSGSVAFVKIFDPPEPRKKKKGSLFAGIGLSLLGFSSILATFAVIVCLGYTRKLKAVRDQHEFTGGLRSFKYVELERATGYFKEELGRGASGKVYKGTLPDGRVVAVKKLKKFQNEDREMSEKEFRTEMGIIAASHHKNLVQLEGFCDEGCHRLLVYEFMSNGSVEKTLFEGSGYLDWKLRLQIVLGTARGILYLHQERRTQILHCDIKPQNILLDENYNAKIADFGISKLIGADQTRTFTVARGTIGYIAPEWQRNMAITAKVDVYSFGMMLLEIICYRKMMEPDKPENEIILCEWVYECLKTGRLQMLVEQQQQAEEQEKIDVEEMERMVLVGLWCIQEDPFLRPSIKSVVQMLEGMVEIAVPPCPGTSMERPALSGLQI